MRRHEPTDARWARLFPLLPPLAKTSRPPTRPDQRRRPRFDGEAYRRRNLVERAFGRLRPFRRIATRGGKLASSRFAMLTIAAIEAWP